MKNTELSWLFLLDCLADEGKPPSYIRIIDTIVFDPLNSLRPLFWLYNTEAGQLRKHNLRDWTIPEIIDNVLHLYHSRPDSTLYVIHLNGRREVLENPTPNKIISNTLQAVQLFTRKMGMDRRMFANFYRSGSDDKCCYFDNSKEILVEITNPMHFRMRALTGIIISKLKNLGTYNFTSLKILYLADNFSHDPWLIGFEDCIADKSQNLSKSLNLIKEQKLGGSLLRGSSFKYKENPKTLTKGTPMIRGKHIRIKSDEKMLALSKSAYNLNDEISKTLHPSLENSMSKLPIAHSFYQAQCRGQFCKLELVKIPKFDYGVRCLVPLYLIELAQKSDYSPLVYPSLRKVPPDLRNLHGNNTAFRKLQYKKEVPVCLKCYVVYFNVKRKVRQMNK